VQLPTIEEQDYFLREAHHLGRLVHPHIIRLLDCGIQGEKPYLILDYAHNGTLRLRCRRGATLPVSQVVEYVKQIADGLQYAHDQRIIHRDVKPENMLLDSHDTVLLSDFGISLPGQTLPYPKTQDIMGTTGYMAPEQLEGHPAFASDQYALAVVVYEWLSGSVPFKGNPVEVRKQQRSSPAPLVKKVAGVTAELEQVIFKALSEQVTDRFRRVQYFAEALELAANNNMPARRAIPNSPPVQGAAVGGGNVPGGNTPIPPANVGGNLPANIDTPRRNPANAIPPTIPPIPIAGGGLNNPVFNNSSPIQPLQQSPAGGFNNPSPIQPLPQSPAGGFNNLSPNLPPSPAGGFNRPSPNPPQPQSPAGWHNAPMPNPPQPQGHIVLPAGNGNVPQQPPFGGGSPFAPGNAQGPNNQQASLHSQHTAQAHPSWQGVGSPFGGPPPAPFPPPAGPAATKQKRSRFNEWFDRRFLKQPKNNFFVFGGGIVDFLLAVALGIWLHNAILSWDLWLGSLLIALLFRLLCAAIKSRSLAFVFIVPLVIYWYLGSWALGTVLYHATRFEPVPPHIIALIVSIICAVTHVSYVISNKRR
jgi:serine/threonine protein kinase